jgi:hypothetical protein
VSKRKEKEKKKRNASVYSGCITLIEEKMKEAKKKRKQKKTKV